MAGTSLGHWVMTSYPVEYLFLDKEMVEIREDLRSPFLLVFAYIQSDCFTGNCVMPEIPHQILVKEWF